MTQATIAGVGLGADARALGEAVRRLLAERWSSDRARAHAEGEEGLDRLTWDAIVEMGLPGVAIPQRYDGQGGGFEELGVVLEEQGRALYAGPFLTTVSAAAAILALGDESQKARLLPRIAAGAIATLAVPSLGRTPATGAEGVEARRTPDGARLRGAVAFVPDLGVAEIVIVMVPVGADRAQAFVVDRAGDAEGMRRVPLRSLDLTRRLSRLELEEATAEPLGDAGASGDTLVAALAGAWVALAHESVGGAQRCLDMAIEHATHRHQFGRPIGSFQAIQHRCADMLVDVESARSAAFSAGMAAGRSDEEASLSVSMAKAVGTDGYFRVAASALQVFGGLGFTWDNDAHLHLRRAVASGTLFGDASYHRRRIARVLGLEPPTGAVA